jgi:hypothetical protein
MIARSSFWKAFLIGLIPLAIGAAVLTASSKKMGPIAGAIGTGLFVMWGFSGLAGYASLIGRRLWKRAAPWRQTRNGALILSCVAALPAAGWALALPFLAVLGMGVNIMTPFKKLPPRKESPQAPAAE